MPASFLHGIETIEIATGPVPITVVKSAVIGLVGSAPLWAAVGAPAMWQPSWVVAAGQQVVDPNGNIQQCSTAGTTGTSAPTWATALNTTSADGTAVWKLVTIAGTVLQAPTLVNFTANPNIAGSAAAYGPLMQGYTIPYALAAIQAQGAGQVIVVNVFNPYLHYTAIAAQAMAMPASGPQILNLGHMGVWNVVVKNGAGSTTYINGTDYTLDPINGIVTQKAGGAITTGEALSLSFSYADPSKMQDSDVVGSVTGTMYTGIQALRTTYGTMGFFPKILIAPGYSQDAAAASAAGLHGVYDSRDSAYRLAAVDLSGDCDRQPRRRGQRVRHQLRPGRALLSAGEILRPGPHPDRRHDQFRRNPGAERGQRYRGGALLAVGGWNDRGQGPAARVLVVALQYSDDRPARSRRNALRLSAGRGE